MFKVVVLKLSLQVSVNWSQIILSWSRVKIVCPIYSCTTPFMVLMSRTQFVKDLNYMPRGLSVTPANCQYDSIRQHR